MKSDEILLLYALYCCHMLTHRDAVQQKAVQLYAAGWKRTSGHVLLKGELGIHSSALVEIATLDGNFETKTTKFEVCTYTSIHPCRPWHLT